MRIAHLSDLHLCSNFKKSNIAKIKGLIEHALENGAQHFVFTGDISDNAEEKELIQFRDLLQSFSLLHSEKSSIVIGNHDIFGGPQTAQDVLNFPFKCLNVSYKEKVMRFAGHFHELFENTIRPHEEVFFPFIKELKNIVLVGLNSIDEYSRIKNPFASNGRISKANRNIIGSYLTRPKFNDKVKIVLIHHHFYQKSEISTSSENTLWNKIENYTMKLRGKKKLLNLFSENNVKLVLHGHSHEMREYFRKKIRFVNAGACTEEKQASYFMIDAFPFDISINLHKLDLKEEVLVGNEGSITSIAV